MQTSIIFSRYLSFAPTSPDKKRREIWGTPYCFARKDVGDPTGYLTLLLADYTRAHDSSSALVPQWLAALDQGRNSTSETNPARKGLSSVYRNAFQRCGSSV